MGDALKKVSPSQRLRIPAGAYNAFVDAARFARDRQADLGGAPAALEFALRQMVVHSVGPDHLVCRRLEPDGSVGVLDVYVLKPWTLRRTPFDGQTLGGKTYAYQDNTTRTVTQGGEEETQAVTPDYEEDSGGGGGDSGGGGSGGDSGGVIFAAVTNVLGQLDPEDVYAPDRTVLVDVNVDGRAWAVMEDV